VNAPFHDSTIGKFMICHDLLETKLVQLFAHSENSECFTMISVITFEVNIAVEQKQALLETRFLFL